MKVYCIMENQPHFGDALVKIYLSKDKADKEVEEWDVKARAVWGSHAASDFYVREEDLLE